MSLEETMRRAAGEYGPRCELCEASPSTPELHLPSEHHPKCPKRFSAHERSRLIVAEEAKLRKALADSRGLVVQTLPASQRRADMQRGARAAVRLIRERAARLPNDATWSPSELAEDFAKHIEHDFSDAEMTRRVLKAIDDAVLGEFDARSEPEGTRR
jgi:hypothetical protein